MKDILKQRLVGALILVALGVVFWPIIFVEQGRQTEDERTAIPPRPAVETAAIERPSLDGLRPSGELQSQREAAGRDQAASESEPDPAPVVASSTVTEQATAVATGSGDADTATTPAAAAPASRIRTEAPVSPEIDAEGVPVAWILQVASVSSADKAEQLRLQLLAMDQKAYVKRVRRGDSDLYRVYVGPKFERARLEALKPRVDAEFRVTSMVVRYLP